MSDLQWSVISLFVSLSLSNTHTLAHLPNMQQEDSLRAGTCFVVCVFALCVCLGLPCYWMACDQSHFCVVNQRRFCLLKKGSKGPNVFIVPLILTFTFNILLSWKEAAAAAEDFLIPTGEKMLQFFALAV